MKPICSICGRRTLPAVYLGSEVIGPTCAKRLGLTKRQGAGKNSRVRFASQPARQVASVSKQLDMFGGGE